MKTAYWHRTGLAVWIVAAGIVLVLALVGPLVYAVRGVYKACSKEWRALKEVPIC